MAFFEVEFPRAISFQRVGGDTFSTAIIGADSGFEQRQRNWPQSRAEWTASLITPNSADASRQAFVDALHTFFLVVGGMADGFRYYDHLDCVADHEAVLSLGSNHYQLQRTYSLAGRTYVRTVTKPITASVKDYKGVALANSVTLYDGGGGILSGTVDHTTGIATCTGALASASFRYHIPVRFTSDKFAPQVEPSNVGGGQPIVSWNSLGLIEVLPPNY